MFIYAAFHAFTFLYEQAISVISLYVKQPATYAFAPLKCYQETPCHAVFDIADADCNLFFSKMSVTACLVTLRPPQDTNITSIYALTQTQYAAHAVVAFPFHTGKLLSSNPFSVARASTVFPGSTNSNSWQESMMLGITGTGVWSGV